MKTYEQEPPFCVQVELSEGCNLYCNFCGLQGIREQHDKNFKFMTVGTAARIASLMKEAGWRARLEFAMHGEPTMNPNAAEIIGIFREILPRQHIMMTSNGGGLLGKDVTERINALFDAGLNVLALDNYEYVKIVPKLIEKYEGPRVWNYYPQNPDANPHKRRHHTEELLVVIQDISVAEEGTHSTLNNHAGAAFPKNDKARGHRCAKPFREMSVRWDGNVAICCNDWRGEFKVGNVLEVTHINEIWHHPSLNSARKYLYHGKREFGPCKGCDAISYRPGLLPDHRGQEYLGHPTEFDEENVARACNGPSYTTPVNRPWELTVEGKSVS